MYGRIGQTALTLNPGATQVRDAAPVEAYPPQLPAADAAMQTVRPDAGLECPPCPPPQVVYKDRIVYRDRFVDRPVQVPVPGPTQYVYVDRAGQTFTMPPAGMLPGGSSPSSVPNSVGTPEPMDDASAGHAADAGATRRRSYWWLLLVGGAAYLALRERKST